MDLTKSTDKLSTNILVLKKNKLPKSSLNKFNSKKKKLFISKKIKLLFIFLFSFAFFIIFKNKDIILKFFKLKLNKKSDREQWVDLAYKIAAPVLENMSKGLLQKNMIVEYSPTYGNRYKKVLFMECFGRLMDGISPWLSLPQDETKEGKIRKKLLDWALLSYKNAVDPNSPDMLLWSSNNTRQPLVDAAFLAESFLRAPEIWKKLDKVTQQRYIDCFKIIRNIEPYNSNWLLFSGIIECFFIMVGEEPDKNKMLKIVNSINNWYVGDGWYSDGPTFVMNYYNSFVIHPMLVQMLEIMEKNKIKTPISSKLALKRMQRFNIFIERLISPEGQFPAFGRSIVYKMGVFQTLALSAWKYDLPKYLTYGGVRSALTKIMNNMFNIDGNFNEGGFLSLGFVGHQPNVSNYYSNNGSTYLTSVVFLPLGLPSNHPFWTEPAKPWTSQMAWSGNSFPIDQHESLKKI